MSRPFRLPPDAAPQFGRLIDRRMPVSFSLNGRTLGGFAGDTLASALLGAGVRALTQSRRYHRPRGISGIGDEDCGGLLTLTRDGATLPSCRVAEQPLVEGAALRSGDGRTRGTRLLLPLARPFLQAGFAYKTFLKPRQVWPRAEQALRRIAGGGFLPRGPQTASAEHVHLRVDLLVVGGGLAGLAAAEAAAAAGKRVLLAEREARLGGLADAYDGRIDGQPLLAWVRQRVAALSVLPNVHVLARTRVAGLHGNGFATLVEAVGAAERLWQVHADAVVLASGAHEKPLVFSGNDRPGIMSATAARLYLRRYAVAPGRRIVIATAGDEGYRTALDCLAAGLDVVRIVDLRLTPDGSFLNMAKASGLPISVGSVPYDTSAERGGRVLSGVTIANRLVMDGAPLTHRIACDTLLVSGGWSPALDLAAQAGAELRYDSDFGALRLASVPEGFFVAGLANGVFNAADVLEDGRRAGTDAVAYLGGTAPKPPTPLNVEITRDDAPEAATFLPSELPPPFPETAFVDPARDTTVADYRLAAAENYRGPMAMERYAASGLGALDGRSEGVGAAEIRQAFAGPGAAALPASPPLGGIRLDLLAGARRGSRLWPLRASTLGKRVSEHPRSRRPAAFQHGNEGVEEAIRREVRTVRNACGVSDLSPVGKILVSGPDAARFLDAVSISAASATATGTARYTLFLDRNGFVRADALIARLDETRFWLCGVSGGTQTLLDWLEELRQTEYAHLAMALVDETERWGQLLIAGPRGGEVLASLFGDDALQDFPLDGAVDTALSGFPARLLANRYTGEMGVALAVPSGAFPELWTQALAAAQALEGEAFGYGALLRLRLEAGHADMSLENDGSRTPAELRLGHLADTAEGAFTGAAALQKAALAETARPRLFGVLLDEAGLVVPPGTHLLSDPESHPARVLGHITSSGFSPTLHRALALGFADSGLNEGDRVFVQHFGEARPGRLVNPHFLDMERPWEERP